MIIPAKIENDTKQPDLSGLTQEQLDNMTGTRYLPDTDEYKVSFGKDYQIEQIRSRLNEVQMPGGGPLKKLEDAIADLDQRITDLENA